mmetsp:Transcript_2296/g.4870  ORF Transcript_2296/g.4870 Transcript_2296/m.4870 type:complete len:239 (+) Transcript_2296:789-1505(+)
MFFVRGAYSNYEDLSGSFLNRQQQTYVQLGINRMLRNVGQQESPFLSRSITLLGLLGLSCCWAYQIEIKIAKLRYGTPAMKTQAARRLYLAPGTVDNRVQIVEAGGIEPLFALLQDGTPQGKAWATLVLYPPCILPYHPLHSLSRPASLRAPYYPPAFPLCLHLCLLCLPRLFLLIRRLCVVYIPRAAAGTPVYMSVYLDCLWGGTRLSEGSSCLLTHGAQHVRCLCLCLCLRLSLCP